MDLLSGSLAQLRRFSAASHQGVDDLTCTGPSVTARSWKALYSSWVFCVFNRECCDELTRCVYTMDTDACSMNTWKWAVQSYVEGSTSVGSIIGLGTWDAGRTSLHVPNFSVAPYCLFCSIQDVVHTGVLTLVRYWSVDSIRNVGFPWIPEYLQLVLCWRICRYFFFVALPLCPHHHLAFSCVCVQVLKVNGYTYLCVYETNLYKRHFFGDSKKKEGFSFLFISVWICCI